MSQPQISLCFPGTAREALTRYHEIFGGEMGVNTFAEFGRTDGPADAVAFGMLKGHITLFAFDAGQDGAALRRMEGCMLTLLGDDAELHTRWFKALAEGGEIIDDLQQRPWGDYDGSLRDRFGVMWLIGYSGGPEGAAQGGLEK